MRGEGVEINIFYVSMKMVFSTRFGAPPGLSCIDPVRGSVTGSHKTSSFYKGLQEIDRVPVDSLPIIR